MSDAQESDSNESAREDERRRVLEIIRRMVAFGDLSDDAGRRLASRVGDPNFDPRRPDHLDDRPVA